MLPKTRDVLGICFHPMRSLLLFLLSAYDFNLLVSPPDVVAVPITHHAIALDLLRFLRSLSNQFLYDPQKLLPIIDSQP